MGQEQPRLVHKRRGLSGGAGKGGGRLCARQLEFAQGVHRLRTVVSSEFLRSQFSVLSSQWVQCNYRNEELLLARIRCDSLASKLPEKTTNPLLSVNAPSGIMFPFKEVSHGQCGSSAIPEGKYSWASEC